GAARVSKHPRRYQRKRTRGADDRAMRARARGGANPVRHRLDDGGRRGKNSLRANRGGAARGYSLAQLPAPAGSEAHMIIDINAFVGHYPFRQLTCTHAADLLALMERNGITRAVVSSLHAAFYRDAHRGNEELFEDVARVGGNRLIAVATINPKYAGWQRDLAQAAHAWRAKAIALTPEYHGYALADEHGRAALAAIAERDVPVVLTQRLEDRRQRHAWDRAEDLRLDPVLAAAAA